ncbi:MAG: hypothetical protein IPJ38_01010 [Dechloromonas sp.]|uniref:Uncharacterized protein n=1 Tax=Candidatus Dechloromonas phosphorivorans TaxID=2899244 RepID=A0A935JUA8_9RHOO|nr:hypothetical protein [Candidatus Dechloromonas phosphorivorans]
MKRACDAAPARAGGRSVDQNALQAIEEAIRASETVHRGELRFVLDRRFSLFQLLRGLTARQRAEALFDELGMLRRPSAAATDLRIRCSPSRRSKSLPTEVLQPRSARRNGTPCATR